MAHTTLRIDETDTGALNVMNFEGRVWITPQADALTEISLDVRTARQLADALYRHAAELEAKANGTDSEILTAQHLVMAPLEPSATGGILELQHVARDLGLELDDTPAAGDVAR